MAFQGVDIRQTGDRILTRAFLLNGTGAVLATGTVTVAFYELQADETLKSFDFADNTFKTTALTTPTAALTHQAGNNGTVNTGLWTHAQTVLTGFTAGNIYLAQFVCATATPTTQTREIQFGAASGFPLAIPGDKMDLKDAPNGTAVTAIQLGLATGEALAAAVLPLATSEALAAIKARTDLIGGAGIGVVSPVAADGSIEIVAGDDYKTADGTEIEITITAYGGPTLTGATVKLLAAPLAAYEIDPGTATLEVTGTAVMAGLNAVFTFELTGAQTAALETNPPLDRYNYIYQITVTPAASTRRHTVALGALTVKGGVG